LRYPQLLWLFSRFPTQFGKTTSFPDVARHAGARCGTVNETATGRAHLLRTGADEIVFRVHQFKTKARIAARN